MSDSSRKLSARTARPVSGDAIVDARAFLAIEVRGGKVPCAIISHPFLGVFSIQWREFGSPGRPPKHVVGSSPMKARATGEA